MASLGDATIWRQATVARGSVGMTPPGVGAQPPLGVEAWIWSVEAFPWPLLGVKA